MQREREAETARLLAENPLPVYNPNALAERTAQMNLANHLIRKMDIAGYIEKAEMEEYYLSIQLYLPPLKPEAPYDHQYEKLRQELNQELERRIQSKYLTDEEKADIQRALDKSKKTEFIDGKSFAQSYLEWAKKNGRDFKVCLNEPLDAVSYHDYGDPKEKARQYVENLQLSNEDPDWPKPKQPQPAAEESGSAAEEEIVSPFVTGSSYDIDKLYSLYCSLPLGTTSNWQQSILYTNNWCVLTGRSISAPHPHRYYTNREFRIAILGMHNLRAYLTRLHDQQDN
jgi:hypothetical protein